MKEFGNIESFVEHLAVMEVAQAVSARRVLNRCGVIVERRSKEKVGEYQDQTGPFVAWQELADFTKEDRLKQGYTENDPGLRSGEMRDSIGHALSTDSLEVQIGSNDQNMVYFELGTSKQPPRSVLGGAMADSLTKIEEVIEKSLFTVLASGKPEAALVGEEVVEGGIAIGK
jgi:HK97 gp10 family phage protein